jgi:hypothetical protein
LGGVQGREPAYMPKAVGKCACLDLQWLVAGKQQSPYCPQPRQWKIPILASAITTKSKGPLTGIIELRTEGGPIELGIDEDATLALRTDLERFLTQ